MLGRILTQLYLILHFYSEKNLNTKKDGKKIKCWVDILYPEEFWARLMNGDNHNPVIVCKFHKQWDDLVCSQAIQPCRWFIKQHDLCLMVRNNIKTQVNWEQMLWLLHLKLYTWSPVCNTEHAHSLLRLSVSQLYCIWKGKNYSQII